MFNIFRTIFKQFSFCSQWLASFMAALTFRISWVETRGMRNDFRRLTITCFCSNFISHWLRNYQPYVNGIQDDSGKPRPSVPRSRPTTSASSTSYSHVEEEVVMIEKSKYFVNTIFKLISLLKFAVKHKLGKIPTDLELVFRNVEYYWIAADFVKLTKVVWDI